MDAVGVHGGRRALASTMASHAMLAPIAADAGARGAAVFIDLTEAHSPKKEAPDLALKRLKVRIFSLRDATTRTNT